MDDLYTDIAGIQKLGFVVYSITKQRTVQAVLKTTLSKVIADSIFEEVNNSVSDIVTAPPRETCVYLCTEKWFDNFCKFASRSTSRNAECRERCVLFNLLYTNHDNFVWEDIPVYVNEKLKTKCIYKRDKVYSVRIVSEEIVKNEKKFTEDVILYLPNSYINIL